MISRSKKLDLVFIIILISMLVFGVGYRLGYSFTGTTNTFAVGSLETNDVNFTGSWYRGTTDLTDRLLGDWTINLNSTTLNTGQGENELYDMDQNVLIASSVTFDSLNATQLYWDSLNRTILLSGQNGTRATAFVGFDDNLDYLPNFWLCDGTADDIQIQAAIDYVDGFGGGDIYVSQGDYFINSTIIMKDNIRLSGANRNASILHGTSNLGNTASTGPIIYIFQKSYVVIENLGFDGADMDTSPYETHRKALNGDQNDHVTIRNNKIQNVPATGIGIDGTDYLYVLNNYVFNCGTFGESAGSNGIGIGVSSDHWIIIQNNYVEDNNNAGILLEGFTDNTWGKYAIVTDNVAAGNIESGIRIDGMEHFVISDNIVKGNKDGIRLGIPAWKDPLNPSRNGIVDGNLVRANIRDGIRVMENGSVNISISNNMVNDNTDDGIYLNSNNVNVANNHLYGNGGSPIEMGAGINPIRLKDNFGFVTENEINQIVANNENVIHGLAGIPDYITITNGNSTYDGVPIVVGYNITGVDATNIPVSVYWVNGTAITDDIIFVTVKAIFEP